MNTMGNKHIESILPVSLRFLHPHLHFFGLLLIAVGLPFSEFMMSFGQFWLVGNWILEAKFNKAGLFFKNRNALLLSGIFLMLIPGIFYSENMHEAGKILRINLPFLVLPFILSQRQALPVHSYYLLIRLFMLAVFLAAVVCLIAGLPKWLAGEYSDIRQISIFISHIRFSLLISFVTMMAIWFISEKPFPMHSSERIFWVLAILFLVLFLLILQALSGIFVLIFLLLFWMLSVINRRMKRRTAMVIFLFGVSAVSLGSFFIYQSYLDYTTPHAIYSKPLPPKTRLGNPYIHKLGVIENGHYINTFLCEKELYTGWKSMSKIPLDSLDGKGNPVKSTLIRFLNSRGLTKDAEGLRHLSRQEVSFIEKGIANVKYTGLWGIRMRYYQLLWELNSYNQDISTIPGHSLRMKLEYWRISLSIILKHPIIGVGTGDVPGAFRKEYENSKTRLDSVWWKESHNQYLYITVASGILGFIVFMVCLISPMLIIKNLRSYMPFKFFIIMVFISMITEDMLTTQAGVSIVAFFYSLFLLARPSEESTI